MPAIIGFILVIGVVYQLFFRYERWNDDTKPGIIYEHDNLSGKTRAMGADGSSSEVPGGSSSLDGSDSALRGRIFANGNARPEDYGNPSQTTTGTTNNNLPFDNMPAPTQGENQPNSWDRLGGNAIEDTSRQGRRYADNDYRYDRNGLTGNRSSRRTGQAQSEDDRFSEEVERGAPVPGRRPSRNLRARVEQRMEPLYDPSTMNSRYSEVDDSDAPYPPEQPRERRRFSRSRQVASQNNDEPLIQQSEPSFEDRRPPVPSRPNGGNIRLSRIRPNGSDIPTGEQSSPAENAPRSARGFRLRQIVPLPGRESNDVATGEPLPRLPEGSARRNRQNPDDNDTALTAPPLPSDAGRNVDRPLRLRQIAMARVTVPVHSREIEPVQQAPLQAQPRFRRAAPSPSANSPLIPSPNWQDNLNWRDTRQIERLANPAPVPGTTRKVRSSYEPLIPLSPRSRRVDTIQSVQVSPYASSKIDLDQDGLLEEVIESAVGSDGLMNISIVKNGREIFFGRGRQISLLPTRSFNGWSDIALQGKGRSIQVYRYSRSQETYTALNNHGNNV